MDEYFESKCKNSVRNASNEAREWRMQQHTGVLIDKLYKVHSKHEVNYRNDMQMNKVRIVIQQTT